MRTTLNIDDGFFKDIIKLTNARTKTEAVRIALEEFIRLKRKEQLLSLRGKIEIEDTSEELPITRHSI